MKTKNEYLLTFLAVILSSSGYSIEAWEHIDFKGRWLNFNTTTSEWEFHQTDFNVTFSLDNSFSNLSGGITYADVEAAFDEVQIEIGNVFQCYAKIDRVGGAVFIGSQSHDGINLIMRDEQATLGNTWSINTADLDIGVCISYLQTECPETIPVEGVYNKNNLNPQMLEADILLHQKAPFKKFHEIASANNESIAINPVLLHEILHGLGLRHSDLKDSKLAPNIAHGKHNYSLIYEDKQSMIRLYGGELGINWPLNNCYSFNTTPLEPLKSRSVKCCPAISCGKEEQDQYGYTNAARTTGLNIWATVYSSDNYQRLMDLAITNYDELVGAVDPKVRFDNTLNHGGLSAPVHSAPVNQIVSSLPADYPSIDENYTDNVVLNQKIRNLLNTTVPTLNAALCCDQDMGIHFTQTQVDDALDLITEIKKIDNISYLGLEELDFIYEYLDTYGTSKSIYELALDYATYEPAI